MKAQALVCDEQQRFTLEEVRLKEPAVDQVAVRTAFSGVSIGTEFALIRNKLSWGPYPLCTGYQGTGIVETVGAEVEGLKVGDQVYFRGNDYLERADGQPISCVAGTHCSRVVRRAGGSHGVAKLPPGARLDVAAQFVMPAVGLAGVDMANPRLGDRVLVHGAGLIGLGVIAACSHRGCEVIAVDLNPRQLELARRMGADHLIDGSASDVEAEVKRIVPDGADVVFECTGIPECLDAAIKLCRTEGSFVWQGNYGQAPISLHFLPAHGRRLRMFFPCDDGWIPCRRAVIKNMAMGALRWEECITHRITSRQAPELFARINRGDDKEIIGVIIEWSE
ncbi:MAG: zinc-binding dehydrogenase [Candidatus Latescibacterota bacterium]|jgi:2-desacetyl-2-hydroxyethyl bacteriochlorophyllide A dehydrogenase